MPQHENTACEVPEVPVVILGGGISGLATAARLSQLEVPFVLLEREARLGGQIHTKNTDGFTYEVGPNTGTLSNPELVALLKYCEPQCQLQVADEAAKARWIWYKNRFESLPSSLVGGARTPLFSLRDKLRILAEPWRKPGNNPQETVGELAERRLGKTIVQYAVDPFIGGIYAGNPYALVTKYALPKLYNLEQEYGSFIKGSLAKAKLEQKRPEAGVSKQVFSVQGGFSQLILALEQKLVTKGKILTSANPITVQPSNERKGRWQVCYRVDGAAYSVNAKMVVSTIPAKELPAVFPTLAADQLNRVATLPYAPVAEVTVGFKKLPGINLRAFGGLVPSCEGRKVLGILFPSSCFAGRVPTKESALFTIFMGGTRNAEEVVNRSEAEIKQTALTELYAMLPIPADMKPDLIEVNYYPEAIPQYDHSYEPRLEAIRALEKVNSGLLLAGGVRDGVGLANRVAQGWKTAEEAAEYLKV